MTNRPIIVYQGLKNNEIVHIGITSQEPQTRFRTHEKRHLIDRFEVIASFDEVGKALTLEKELILKYKPKYSTRVKQNDNRRKSLDEIQSRVYNPEWCQKCLKRRVNNGYNICYRCEHQK